MDVNGSYATYNTFPGGVGARQLLRRSARRSSRRLLLQWKRGPLAITPAIQFAGGIRYGVPLSTPGIDPSRVRGRTRRHRRRTTRAIRTEPRAARRTTRPNVRQQLRDPEPVHGPVRQRRRVRLAEPAAAAHAGHVRREQARHARRQLREHHQPLLGRYEGSVRDQPRVQLRRDVRRGLGSAAGREPVQPRRPDPTVPLDPVRPDCSRTSRSTCSSRLASRSRPSTSGRTQRRPPLRRGPFCVGRSAARFRIGANVRRSGPRPRSAGAL